MNTNFQDWESPPEGALPRWFQDRGRAFERIIKKVLDDAGCEPRGSLRPSGEEIDGSFYLGGKTYLLEAKWRKQPIPASDLYAFKGKVDGKLVGTIGVFISMSDYSADAIDALKAGKEINLILFSAADFKLVIQGAFSVEEAMKRKLRYAAEEGQPYRPLAPDKSQGCDILEDARAGDEIWDLVVEGRSDEIALRILFERMDASDKVRIWTAGGQLAVPSLIRRMQESGHQRIAAFVESDIKPNELDELHQLFQKNSNHLIVVEPNFEDWLEWASPNDIVVSSPPTSIREKAIRRFASVASISELIKSNKNFADLLQEMLGS